MAVMSQHRLEVMQRRQALLAKIAGQREQLADLGTRWRPALLVADQAWVAVKFLRAHAVLVAGVALVAGLVVVRRRGPGALVKGAWRVWKTYRYVREAARKIAQR